MEFKRSCGFIYDVKLNAKEKRALDDMVRRQLSEYTRKHIIEFEATVIRNLRRASDWDENQLRAFYDKFDDDLQALVKHYEMGEDDLQWLCTRELKQEGIDIEQWHRERYPNEKYEVG